MSRVVCNENDKHIFNSQGTKWMLYFNSWQILSCISKQPKDKVNFFVCHQQIPAIFSCNSKCANGQSQYSQHTIIVLWFVICEHVCTKLKKKKSTVLKKKTNEVVLFLSQNTKKRMKYYSAKERCFYNCVLILGLGTK